MKISSCCRSLVVGRALLGYSALAGGDKVVFPEDFDKGTLYGTVDRHDIKQYRELWATPAAVDAVRKGEPIPSGTVLTLVQYKAQVDAAGNPVKDAKAASQKGDLVAYTVMEKRAGWGTEYKDDIRNGEWEYQAFGPDKKVNEKANLTACFQCHKPHAGQDFVISLASLKGTPPGDHGGAARRARALSASPTSSSGPRPSGRAGHDRSPGTTPTARRIR